MSDTNMHKSDPAFSKLNINMIPADADSKNMFLE